VTSRTLGREGGGVVRAYAATRGGCARVAGRDHRCSNETVRFELGPSEVEITIVAKREGGPNGKIKFEVLGLGAELGGGAKLGGEKTQNVKLNLTPVKILPDGSQAHLEISRVPQPDYPASTEEPLIRRPS
jgi:Trypsin-co-occurring domain 2